MFRIHGKSEDISRWLDSAVFQFLPHLKISREIVDSLRVEKLPDDVRRFQPPNGLDVLDDSALVITFRVQMVSVLSVAAEEIATIKLTHEVIIIHGSLTIRTHVKMSIKPSESYCWLLAKLMAKSNMLFLKRSLSLACMSFSWRTKTLRSSWVAPVMT